MFSKNEKNVDAKYFAECLTNKDYDTALEVAETFINNNNDAYFGYNLLVNVYANKKDWPFLMDYLGGLEEKFCSEDKFWEDWGSVVYNIGGNDAVVDFLNKHEKCKTHAPAVYYQFMYGIMKERGQDAEAQKLLEECKNSYTIDDEELKLILDSYIDGDYKEAIKYAEKKLQDESLDEAAQLVLRTLMFECESNIKGLTETEKRTSFNKVLNEMNDKLFDEVRKEIAELEALEENTEK